MIEVATVPARNDLERMGVSGLRETMLGRANEACCGDCRFLMEGQSITHPCTMGHGRKDLFSRFAMICADFALTPGIDEEIERRGGGDRRQQSHPVTNERRKGDRRVQNTYCSRLVLPQAQ